MIIAFFVLVAIVAIAIVGIKKSGVAILTRLFQVAVLLGGVALTPILMPIVGFLVGAAVVVAIFAVCVWGAVKVLRS